MICRIIKINMLSLFLLPLLLIATTAKLIAKALEKISTIIVMILLISALVIVFEIAKNPMQSINVIAAILLYSLLVGLFLVIIFGVLSAVTLVLQGVIGGTKFIFDCIYEFLYKIYAKVYSICRRDYDVVCQDLSSVSASMVCIFYSILRLVNRIIIEFLVQAVKIAVVLSVLAAGGAFYFVNQSLFRKFGVGAFSYLKRFSVANQIYIVLVFAIIVSCAVIILMSLGIEWNEWGEKMSVSTLELPSYDEQTEDMPKKINSHV